MQDVILAFMGGRLSANATIHCPAGTPPTERAISGSSSRVSRGESGRGHDLKLGPRQLPNARHQDIHSDNEYRQHRDGHGDARAEAHPHTGTDAAAAQHPIGLHATASSSAAGQSSFGSSRSEVP